MNTQLVTAPGRQSHPPQPDSALNQRPVRRVGLLDRAALHLGVALIKWGRRPNQRESREGLASWAETHEARRKLEQIRVENEMWGADLTRLK